MPRIVCICGSRSFAREMQVAAIDRTLHGEIVLLPNVMQRDIAGTTKAMLDELHLRKIDLADEVLVINVDGYIGESTRREIDYALAAGKPVRYAEEWNAQTIDGVDEREFAREIADTEV